LKTENLLKGKARGGFRVLAAVLLLFSPVFVGCDTGAAGTDAAPYERAAAAGRPGIRTVKVKFEVKESVFVLQGSEGIVSDETDRLLSEGIVSDETDRLLVWGRNENGPDYCITVFVPETDRYLNIRWTGWDLITRRITYIKAVLPLNDSPDYTITVDYKGYNHVAAKNLRDVSISGSDDWDWAFVRAVRD